MPFQIQSDLSLQPSADPVAQVQQFSHSQAPAAPEDFSPADLEVPAPVQTPEALPDIQSPVTTVISSTPSPAPEAAAVRVYVGEAFAGVGAPQADGTVRFRAMLLRA